MISFNSKLHLATLLLLFLLIPCSAQNRIVTIAGNGGNDVVAVNKLVSEVLKDDFAALKIDVQYFPVESDYSRFILNALSSGNAPDAFYVSVDMIDNWVATDQLQAISARLREASRNINPVLLKAYTIEGKLYGIPKDVNTLGLQFNTDIFDDAKVAYPNTKDTWFTFKDKLAQVVNAIGDEGVLGTCLSPDYAHFAPFALSTGWQPFNENNQTILDERFQRAFGFYVSLIHDGLAKLPADVGQNWPGGCFGTENSAVVMEGQWLSGYLTDKAPNLLYQSTLIPKDPLSQGRGNLLFTVGWAINKNTSNPDDVEKVIELLTSEKAQNAILVSGLALPSLLSATEFPFFSQDNPSSQMAKTILTASTSGNVMPHNFSQYGKLWQQPIDVALTAAMLGQLSITDALAEAQKQYNTMVNTPVKQRHKQNQKMEKQ